MDTYNTLSPSQYPLANSFFKFWTSISRVGLTKGKGIRQHIGIEDWDLLISLIHNPLINDLKFVNWKVHICAIVSCAFPNLSGLSSHQECLQQQTWTSTSIQDCYPRSWSIYFYFQFRFFTFANCFVYMKLIWGSNLYQDHEIDINQPLQMYK